MFQQILLFAIFITGMLYIVFDFRNKASLRYISKPLTTLLIILLAVLQEPEVSEYYKYLIISGLVFSLAGDIFLMLPKDRFIAGLGSFFIAHLFFIFAFASDFGPYWGWGYLIPIAIYAVVFLKILLPHTKKMTIPVIAYVLVLLAFLWQASGRGYVLGGSSPALAFFGAVLFVASDSILAYDRFVKGFKFASFFIMLTYWLAQVFIALSI
ncbi:MAG: lysoplasmalogenase [Bacteroidetes bacterium]|nr:MAG: lysoplasmalogenase [Bacteroidota bacterium]